MNAMRHPAKTIRGMIAPNTVKVKTYEMINISTMTIKMKRVPLINMEILVPRVSWITCTSELSLLTKHRKRKIN